MAWTINRFKTVFGDRRVVGVTCSADAATQAVDTGLSIIDWMSVGIVSMTTTSSYHVAINSNASGVQANGTLGCSGFTSGDVVHFTVYGR